ncbi:hypothetical protein Tco_0008157 [Tanacetum coccineum]
MFCTARWWLLLPRDTVLLVIVNISALLTLKSVSKRYGRNEHFILPIQVSTARVDVTTAKVSVAAYDYEMITSQLQGKLWLYDEVQAVSSQMVSTAKLPVLHPVIVNGDLPLPNRTVDGVEKTYPPTTAEEKLARKNELKAREGLDQTYDRLQKLISQLEILGETISQEDMNLKFLRSLPSKWKTHTLIWRNTTDLDTLIMDDLYNNLNIYATEVKGSSS